MPCAFRAAPRTTLVAPGTQRDCFLPLGSKNLPIEHRVLGGRKVTKCLLTTRFPKTEISCSSTHAAFPRIRRWGGVWGSYRSMTDTASTTAIIGAITGGLCVSPFDIQHHRSANSETGSGGRFRIVRFQNTGFDHGYRDQMRECR